MGQRRPLEGDLWFCAEEADRVVEWWQSTLRLTEGLWAAQPFVLEDWQREEIVRPVFGWLRWDPQWDMWVRRYSTVWIEIPRGDGKTPIAAGTILEGLVADGEQGAQNYGAAEDKEQAGVVYRDVRLMVKYSPLLARRLKVIDSRKRIVDEETNSFYQALPRDEMGEGSQGFKPHIIVVDEVHVQKTKALIQALKKGMGKRVQPMLMMITTAGADIRSPAGEEHLYAIKVLDARARGEEIDPSYFAYVRSLERDCGPNADPWEEANWRACNPALGTFLSVNRLREEAREAKAKPSEVNDFLRFRLNVWVGHGEQKIPLDVWDEAGALDLLTAVEDELAGQRCWGGLDLASTQDLNALVWDFPALPGQPEGEHNSLYRFWIPEERLADLDLRTNNMATVWAREGWLATTPGNVTDYDAIGAQILADGKRFRICQLGFDPWNAGNLVADFEDAPFDLVEIRQTYEQVGPATKTWERLILKRLDRHAGHPVMRWMVGNVIGLEDGNGNWKISKKRSSDKVDGPVARVMALKLALIGAEPEQPGAFVGVTV